jgi:hypothetical protein
VTVPDFSSRTPFDESHPAALALYCSDGRYTRAVEELAAHLGQPRLDVVTLPGGAALLDTSSALLSDRDAVGRGLSFLIEGHAIQWLLLVAHEGCGYYRARFPLLSPEELRARQAEHLRAAGARLAAAHRGLAVELYFARPSSGRRIHFVAVK